MPFSFKYNALFIHIPKTGGSSVEKYLEIVDDKNYGITLDSVLKTEEDYHSTLEQAVQEYAKVINNDTVLIATIREPFLRIISHYSGRRGNWYKQDGLTLSAHSFLFFLLFELPLARLSCFLSLHCSKRLAGKLYPQYNHLFSQSYYLKRIDYLGQSFSKVVICRVSDLPTKLGKSYPLNIPHVRRTKSNTKQLQDNKFAKFIVQCHYFKDFHLYGKFIGHS